MPEHPNAQIRQMKGSMKKVEMDNSYSTICKLVETGVMSLFIRRTVLSAAL